MGVSLQSQLLTLRKLHGLRREELQKLPLCSRPAEAEVMQKVLEAAADTLALVNGNERVRLYVEQQMKAKP